MYFSTKETFQDGKQKGIVTCFSKETKERPGERVLNQEFTLIERVVGEKN